MCLIISIILQNVATYSTHFSELEEVFLGFNLLFQVLKKHSSCKGICENVLETLGWNSETLYDKCFGDKKGDASVKLKTLGTVMKRHVSSKIVVEHCVDLFSECFYDDCKFLHGSLHYHHPFF